MKKYLRIYSMLFACLGVYAIAFSATPPEDTQVYATFQNEHITATVTGPAGQSPRMPIRFESIHDARRFLVRFRKGKTPAAWAGLKSRIAALPRLNYWAVEFAESPFRKPELLSALQSSDVIEFYPDETVSIEATPSDTQYANQWGLSKIQAEQAWDTQTDASDVVVAIIDTGVDYTHPDLQPNLWTNPEDGSHGFTCNNNVVTHDGADTNGHGTHVAGIIGAAGNNDLGVSGVNWDVQMLSASFIGPSGSGSTIDAILCIGELLKLRQQGVNIRVANMSWGSFGGGYPPLKSALQEMEDAGILSVAAAGNNGWDVDSVMHTPSTFNNRGIVSVLATDSSDVVAWFTNLGHVSVDLAAPGVDILSTLPTGDCDLCDPSGYGSLSGTSMATPFVAGVAAALFQKNPALNVLEARDLLLHPSSYDPMTDWASWSSSSGRLNFHKTLMNPLVFAPVLNQFPTIQAPPAFSSLTGQALNIQSEGTDPEGDTLHYSWTRQWGFGLLYNAFDTFPLWFPDWSNITAASVVRDTTLDYYAGVGDSRGGSAQAKSFYTIRANPDAGDVPNASLTLSGYEVPVDTLVWSDFQVNAPGGHQWLGTVSFYGPGGFRFCCATNGFQVGITAHQPGVYRVIGEGMTSEMQFTEPQSQILRVGGAPGIPPIPRITVDRLNGQVPLAVHFDATQSMDPDGQVKDVYVNCDEFNNGFWKKGPSGTCTYTKPGPHILMLEVVDNEGNAVYLHTNISAQPAYLDDASAPSVQIVAPANGEVLFGPINFSVTATDDRGVDHVEFYSDLGLLGSDNTPPYTLNATLAPGLRTIYAKAYDVNEGVGQSEPVTITVWVPVLFSDTFDGGLDQWIAQKGRWLTSGSELLGSGPNKIKIRSTYQGCDRCTIHAKFGFDTPGSRVSLIGWQSGAGSSIELQFNDNTKILLKYKQNGQMITKRVNYAYMDPGQIYDVQLSWDGAFIDATLDGVSLFHVATATAPNPGSITYQIKGITSATSVSGRLQDIEVIQLP